MRIVPKPGETVLQLSERLRPIFGANALKIARDTMTSLRNQNRIDRIVRARNGDILSMGAKLFGH